MLENAVKTLVLFGKICILSKGKSHILFLVVTETGFLPLPFPNAQIRPDKTYFL